MNPIQLISREIETRRMQRQMGLDPSTEIDPGTVREMWQARAQRAVNDRLSRQYRDGDFEGLPADPEFLRGD